LLPPKVVDVIETLENKGYQGYLVGGCVRDVLLKRVPRDYDVATDALPSEVKAIFPRVIPTGEKFGTVTVVDETGEVDVEVTTFRKDGIYVDGRRPLSIRYSKSLEEDVKRRDFTINALALDGRGKIYDYVGGLEDLKSMLIRAVGVPYERFKEDALRMLRAVRLLSELGGNIEKRTKEAIKQNAELIRMISKERIRDELSKILVSQRAGEGIRLLKTLSLLKEIIPELAACVDFDQRNPHHDKCVFEHTLSVLDGVSPKLSLRLAALLHDIGKPHCFSVDEEGVGHAYGHQLKSREMAENILARLKYDSRLSQVVLLLIKEHMSKYGYTREISIKKLIARVGEENLDDLFELQIADIRGAKLPHDFSNVERIREKAKEIIQRGDPIFLEHLAVGGTDLISWGMKPGKELGDMLKAMLRMVWESPEKNNPEDLKKYFKQEYENQRKKT
jgi:tRNA nucleotidyltransferase (CCA-adding enzyme)